MHINNLYKCQDVLLFKRVFVLEKIHGSSAHIAFTVDVSEAIFPIVKEERTLGIRYFSGGADHASFSALFNDEELLRDFEEKVYAGCPVTIYGEAYGGKMQKMSDVYGKDLKFVAFDVKVGDCWLSVPQAAEVCGLLGLDFVWWDEVEANVDLLNLVRDQESTQAVRNGMGNDKESEGIIIRPLIELTKNNGDRIIAKHKRDKFRETAKVRKVVDPAQMEVLKEAQAIADEWVTAMRLEHVIDKLPGVSLGVEFISKLIPAMVEDVKRESEGEVEWTTAAGKAVGKNTAMLVKALCQAKLGILGS
jgi:hypothetical protein